MKITCILLLVVLTGCDAKVSSIHLKKALDACNKNDGTASVLINSLNTEQFVITRATCNDGMVKEFKNSPP